MMTSSSMELLSFVVLKDKAEDVAGRLIKMGIFHPVDIRNIESRIKGLSLFQVEKESHEVEKIKARAASFLRKI
jgi:hypothetical protein